MNSTYQTKFSSALKQAGRKIGAQTWYQDLILGSSTSLGNKTVVFGDVNRENTAKGLREMRAYREKRFLDNLKADDDEQCVKSLNQVIHSGVKFNLMSLIIAMGDKVSILSLKINQISIKPIIKTFAMPKHFTVLVSFKYN